MKVGALNLKNLTVIARCIIGMLFLYMGIVKALQPTDFLKLIRQYDMVDNYLLLNSMAIIIPWLEVFCGLLLILGIALRGAALLILAMLIPFTLIVLKRALIIQGILNIPFCAVKFNCGCGMGEVYICTKLLENGLLIFISCWLLAFHRKGRGSI